LVQAFLKKWWVESDFKVMGKFTTYDGRQMPSDGKNSHGLWLKKHIITGWKIKYIFNLSFCFEETLYRTFHSCFLSNFGLFGYSVSEEKIFRNQPTRNKNFLWWPCLLTDRNEISNLYRRPSIHAFYQVLVHLTKRFQRRFF
jgi:hypothetical protein